MNGAYWAGVASVPALVLAAGACWVVAKGVGFLAERLLTGGAMRLGSQGPRAQRAAFAAVVFAARRGWMVAAGDVALVLVVGMDQVASIEAREALDPPVSLRTLKRVAKVARSADGDQDWDGDEA